MRAVALGSFASLSLALALTAWPQRARAENRMGADGVYGRLARDAVFSLDAHAGALLGAAGTPAGGAMPGPAPQSAPVAPVVALTVRARALDMSGVFLGYHWAFAHPERRDALSFGLDFRPLSFARIFSDLEHGPRALDLFLDSIGFDLGVSWWRPGDAGASGLAFVLGTGAELPLAWDNANAQGVTARISLVWHHALAADVLGPRGESNALLLTVGITGRLTARVGVVPRR